MAAETGLAHEKCVPCEGGVPPLTREEAEALLGDLGRTWTLASDAKSISRDLQFKDFLEAMAFLNRLAEVAEAEGHHPDFCLHGWNKVRLTLSTHAIGGLSRNDLILAAKADALLG